MAVVIVPRGAALFVCALQGCLRVEECREAWLRRAMAAGSFLRRPRTASELRAATAAAAAACTAYHLDPCRPLRPLPFLRDIKAQRALARQWTRMGFAVTVVIANPGASTQRRSRAVSL
jgi:hypothetical protein